MYPGPFFFTCTGPHQCVVNGVMNPGMCSMLLHLYMFIEQAYTFSLHMHVSSMLIHACLWCVSVFIRARFVCAFGQHNSLPILVIRDTISVLIYYVVIYRNCLG